jgi:hypothetical protein
MAAVVVGLVLARGPDADPVGVVQESAGPRDTRCATAA